LGTILVQGIASGIPVVADVLAETVLTLAFIFYFLLDGATIWNWIVRCFPLRRRELVGHLGGSAWVTLRGYLRGMLIVATFDASLIGLGFFALRVPLAGAIAVLIFLGAFIPVVGAAAAGGVGVLVALANGGWPQALAALAIVVVVQEIETNLVSPYAVGRSVKLHPLVALAAAIAGAILAGIPGAILAVPAVAVALRMVVGVQQFSPSQTEDGPQTSKAEKEPIET
jgi:predicted PurR-regulated permease PerM